MWWVVACADVRKHSAWVCRPLWAPCWVTLGERFVSRVITAASWKSGTRLIHPLSALSLSLPLPLPLPGHHSLSLSLSLSPSLPRSRLQPRSAGSPHCNLPSTGDRSRVLQLLCLMSCGGICGEAVGSVSSNTYALRRFCAGYALSSPDVRLLCLRKKVYQGGSFD